MQMSKAASLRTFQDASHPSAHAADRDPHSGFQQRSGDLPVNAFTVPQHRKTLVITERPQTTAAGSTVYSLKAAIACPHLEHINPRSYSDGTCPCFNRKTPVQHIFVQPVEEAPLNCHLQKTRSRFQFTHMHRKQAHRKKASSCKNAREPHNCSAGCHSRTLLAIARGLSCICHRRPKCR